MKKRIKKTLLGIGGAAGILIILIILIIFFLSMPVNKIDNKNLAKQSEMINITLEWG